MMKMLTGLFILGILLVTGCSKKAKTGIEDDQLGFINADVMDEHTNLKSRAKLVENMPGRSDELNRSFENAPPLIPHTTVGFFPIKINKNICLSCHLPENAKKVKAKSVPKTHFSNVRKYLEKIDGKYHNPKEDLQVKSLSTLNNAYFNCYQCHAPQTTVKVNIENLFTPEFRKKFGLKQSNLRDVINEGVKN